MIMVLTGCSTSPGSQSERFVPARPITTIISDTVSDTAEGAWEAVNMPLEDLNLEQKPIPEKLQKIADNPYALPPQMQCENIHKEIAELDVLLGPDICTPDNPTGAPPGQEPRQISFICTPEHPNGASRKGEYVEQGAGMAREQGVGLVSSRTNIIPFRIVVRKISGAEAHARAVDRAYQAGRLRRAFLKGLAATLGPDCLKPLPAGSIIPVNMH